jgi:REP element-mobilizing transposase RayT
MSHSLHKVWLHAIFTTKNREPLINQNVEQRIYDFIRNELNEMGCSVRAINGMSEHIHILFLLNPQKSYADVIKQIKGSSSHWINKQNIIQEKFAWQTGYAAFSVSESVSNKVYQYILNQKKHHNTKKFLKENDEFIKLNKIESTNK